MVLRCVYEAGGCCLFVLGEGCERCDVMTTWWGGEYGEGSLRREEVDGEKVRGVIAIDL